MKKILSLICLCLLVGMAKKSQAQDPHFSQYFATPLLLNPAMTGVMEGSFRVNAIHRSQWNPVTRSYKTYGGSVDVPLKNGWGIGASVIDQFAGVVNYNYLNAVLGISKDFALGEKKNNHLVIGAQGGVTHRNFDPAGAEWGDQYIPGLGYDPANATAETFQRATLNKPDFNAGIMWYNGGAGKKFNPFLGASVYHINQPETDFDENATFEALGLKTVLHAGARIRAGKSIDLLPNIIYLNQGEAQSMVFGLTGYYNTAQADASLLFGCMYRTADGVIPYLGLKIRDYTLAFSYDIVVGDVSDRVQQKNSFEISLSISPFNRSKVENRYICPRL